MQITLEDPFLGKRTIPATDLDLIKDQLRLLKAIRDKNGATLHLLRDIHVYEHIIYGSEPEELAKQYVEKAEELRRETKSLVTKTEIAVALGWPL